jgi:hypothetical protein
MEKRFSLQSVAQHFCARVFIVLLTIVGFAACQTPPPQSPHGAPIQSTRNNCYSLLFQLLEKQKDVSLLRFIKEEHHDVKNLVTRIAHTSAEDGRMLKKFAKEDPTLSLDDLRLPSGEVATRDAIAATEQKSLLHEKGDEFELRLLLTQTEALKYAWHLAMVAESKETNPDRIRGLAVLSEQMKDLYNQVFELLLAKIQLSEAQPVKKESRRTQIAVISCLLDKARCYRGARCLSSLTEDDTAAHIGAGTAHDGAAAGRLLESIFDSNCAPGDCLG